MFHSKDRHWRRTFNRWTFFPFFSLMPLFYFLSILYFSFMYLALFSTFNSHEICLPSLLLLQLLFHAASEYNSHLRNKTQACLGAARRLIRGGPNTPKMTSWYLELHLITATSDECLLNAQTLPTSFRGFSYLLHLGRARDFLYDETSIMTKGALWPEAFAVM